MAPFTVMIRSVLSYASSAIADTHPDHRIADLHTAARNGTRATLGDDACQYVGIQHLTTAYAYAEADSDAAQRLLRRVRPSHAPLHINAVHLVDVAADPQAKTITWETVTRVPLGTAL
ncbi:hypothetical protein ACOT81_27470 [Streptomyces sp. WI04-05B]|uniref:hypothetical protein n=1 Tax=Streptomyces TaxID=1883 RepID=UPI0029BB15E2|nr:MULTISPECIES: hypothetical protein [unclassified Streptomyces]MDX2546170.1 hypothetical protein [Streptomyces sp. WI04-05B]MDX2587140.1 hypothetical protein [Streptomyces sp. WI04-05A]MDX3750677.1 hypothetical protein [Streptomyces sp. AK08-02]